MLLSIVILFSLTIGSFANNIISYYIDEAEFDLFRSRCMCGEKTLRLKYLVPIFSYVFLKGKCFFCMKKISVRFLIVELFSALIAITCYFSYSDLLTIIIFTTLYVILLCIGIIDYYSYQIPNTLVIVILIVFFMSVIYQQTIPLVNLITGGIVSILFISANLLSNWKTGVDLIGYGDIKLILVLLLFFNMPVSLIALWFSSLIALPGFYYLKRTNKRILRVNKVPFGLFLAIGFTFIGLVGEGVEESFLYLF